MLLVTDVFVCVYLCLAACALLDQATRQGGSHRIALKKAANTVAKTNGNQLLEESDQTQHFS